MQFNAKLHAAVEKNQSLLCVGLDPLAEKIPPVYGTGSSATLAFCKGVVDATRDLVCAYKPQIAYFAALGYEAILEELLAHIKSVAPDIPIVLDAKRGDIGSTAAQYAREAFERYEADAVTLNPYMGFDAAQPFLEYADKACIFLCRTSNPGAANFQDLDCDGLPLYQRVALTVAESWNQNNNCALVMGATAPSQIAAVRKIVGDMLLLVPGVGAQGGDLQATLAAGLRSDGAGLMINASRSIIYPDADADGSHADADAVRNAALALQTAINENR